MQTTKVINYITKWLKDYVLNNSSSIKGFAIGISDGIDSSVVSTLCARTGLPVLVLQLPIDLSKKQTKVESVHIKWLQRHFGRGQIRSLDVNLTDLYEHFRKVCTEKQTNTKSELALANIQARLRMTTLYYFAQVNDFVVVGTGNKVEDYGVGFFTKYGDGGVDLNPIGDLLKSEVRMIARELNIDQSIVDAPPTDGLFDDMRTDEVQLGATYDEIEWAMNLHERGEENQLEHVDERQKEVMKIYLKRHQANQHKLRPIPRCIIPKELREPMNL